jgi:DNA-binding NarL/FixJ family response regulator
MNKEIPMLRVKDADLDAVVKFLTSQLLGDSRMRATHACVLMVLPLPEAALESSPPPGLTEREYSVLRGVADGRSNAQMAGELNTTVGSIKGTVQSLFRKLGVHTNRRSALVRAAVDSVLSRAVSEPMEPQSNLTEVESAVLDGLRQRRTNREIAHLLQLPEITIKAAVRGICGKLGLTTRKQLTQYLLRDGTGSRITSADSPH